MKVTKRNHFVCGANDGPLLRHKSSLEAGVTGFRTVQDYRHGSSYSSRNLAEDGMVYSVEHPPKPLFREPSIFGSGTQR